MLNVYKFHNQPHILHDYENSWKADPMVAVEVLVQYPDRKDIQSVVLSNRNAILQYVKETGREWPEGLRVLLSPERGSAIIGIMQYAIAVGHRVSVVEQRILLDGIASDLMHYIQHVIKGVWKEAESKIAKSDYHRQEYVRMYLSGDWSKFDKGQYVGEVNGWIRLVQDLINDAVESYNQTIDDQVDDWDDEDEEHSYDPIYVSFEKSDDNKSFIIFNDLDRVGSAVQLPSGNVKLSDLNDRSIVTLDIGRPQDEIWDDVYQYVVDVIAQ